MGASYVPRIRAAVDAGAVDERRQPGVTSRGYRDYSDGVAGGALP